MPKAFEIAGRTIGPGRPVFIVAEMSANHGQEFDNAARIVEAAHEVGADAIKLQTYTPDTMTVDSDHERFRIKGTLWSGKNLYALYKEAYTPWEWVPRLKALADSLGLVFFSTPFDASAVDFLENLGVPCYKVASFELVDTPLLERIGRTGKPVIVSTGMATLEEIDLAVRTLRDAGSGPLVLMKCVSAYPAPPEDMNLRTIPDLGERFQVHVGLSDHTLNPYIPVAAVALGAYVIEKHLTLSRDFPSADQAFSLEPDEFRVLVNAVRMTETALGKVAYGPSPSERESLVFRRSLFVVRQVEAGEILTEENVRSLRPADGLAPRFLKGILGKKAAKRIERGTPLDWSLIE
jgi:pseudaminic acid synthase